MWMVLRIKMSLCAWKSLRIKWVFTPSIEMCDGADQLIQVRLMKLKLLKWEMISNLIMCDFFRMPLVRHAFLHMSVLVWGLARYKHAQNLGAFTSEIGSSWFATIHMQASFRLWRLRGLTWVCKIRWFFERVSIPSWTVNQASLVLTETPPPSMKYAFADSWFQPMLLIKVSGQQLSATGGIASHYLNVDANWAFGGGECWIVYRLIWGWATKPFDHIFKLTYEVLPKPIRLSSIFLVVSLNNIFLCLNWAGFGWKLQDQDY